MITVHFWIAQMMILYRLWTIDLPTAVDIAMVAAVAISAALAIGVAFRLRGHVAKG
jgi:hypothetical protein